MKLRNIRSRITGSLQDIGLVENKHLPQALMKWQAPEFYLVNKSIVWGIILAIITLGLTTIMAFLGQYLFCVVCVLFMAIVLKFAYTKPEIIDYRIEEEGVRISGWLHRYFDDITAFWTSNYKGKHTLFLQSKNIFINYLTIPTGDKPLKKIVKTLEKFIPEKSPVEPPRVKKRKK